MQTDEQHQRVMRAALDEAARLFGLGCEGAARWGWNDRSIGVQARTPHGAAVWLRVVSELATWAYGPFWEGNNEATTALGGVAKPEVLDMGEWHQQDRWFRAEVLTHVASDPVSATPELHTDPRLDESWWASLHASLEALSDHISDRATLSQTRVDRMLRAFFADRVDATVHMWVCAHADLHWNNLTAPRCVLLDWEGWGMAPLGYDVATLYCHSLLVPEVAARVRAEFRDVLDTPDGVRSQLLVIARMLQRSIHGDYPALISPLHRLADELTRR